MTMFNWNGQAGEALVSGYIWIYFVATVPLTLFVIAIWWFFTKQSRARWAEQERWLRSHRDALWDVEGRVMDARAKKAS